MNTALAAPASRAAGVTMVRGPMIRRRPLPRPGARRPRRRTPRRSRSAGRLGRTGRRGRAPRPTTSGRCPRRAARRESARAAGGARRARQRRRRSRGVTAGAGGRNAAAPAARTARPQLVGHALHVQQMARRDVVGGDVAAETAAAQGHRRIEAGRQADRSVRRRRVDARCGTPACAGRTRGSPGRSANGSTSCGRGRRSAGSGCTVRSPRASRSPRSRRAPDRASQSTADGRGRRRPARRPAPACPRAR